MRKYKYLFIIGLGIAFLGLQSCRKIGCTDSTAENYSIYAQKDDNSCIYKKSFTTIVNDWEFYDPHFGATIFWAELTQDIIDNSVVQVSIGNDFDGWSILPLTFPQDGTYSTTIEVVLSAGRVDLTWIDSDLVQPNEPGNRQFKIIIN